MITIDCSRGNALISPLLMRMRCYYSFDSLPVAYNDLFAHGSRQSFCFTRWWFEILARHIVTPTQKLCLFGIETSTTPPDALALLVGREQSRPALFRGPRRLLGLRNYYSMVFGPLLAANIDPAPVLNELGQGIARRSPAYDILRFTGLDRNSPVFEPLAKALRANGYLIQTYFHMGNWHESVVGDTAARYLSRRPSRLRNTLRRKSKALHTQDVELRIFKDSTNLDRGIADYQRVYTKSWQKHEPYPDVIGDLLRHCATKDALRLGVLYLDAKPIASQIWIVWGNKATLYKLTHDIRFNRLSPGTVLTMNMIQPLIERDCVAEIDFGIGDDPYKSQWASQRRELWGITAFNPKSIYGLCAAVRHLGGKKMRSLVRRTIRSVRGRAP